VKAFVDFGKFCLLEKSDPIGGEKQGEKGKNLDWSMVSERRRGETLVEHRDLKRRGGER